MLVKQREQKDKKADEREPENDRGSIGFFKHAYCLFRCVKLQGYPHGMSGVRNGMKVKKKHGRKRRDEKGV